MNWEGAILKGKYNTSVEARDARMCVSVDGVIVYSTFITQERRAHKQEDAEQLMSKLERLHPGKGWKLVGDSTWQRAGCRFVIELRGEGDAWNLYTDIPHSLYPIEYETREEAIAKANESFEAIEIHMKQIQEILAGTI